MDAIIFGAGMLLNPLIRIENFIQKFLGDIPRANVQHNRHEYLISSSCIRISKHVQAKVAGTYSRIFSNECFEKR